MKNVPPKCSIMTRLKKLKIEVRAVNSPSSIRITTKEKQVFTCDSCGNKYYAFYYFCPQCLGAVHSTEKQQTGLRIIAIGTHELPQAVDWIKMLIGASDTALGKPLQHLPFTLLEKSDHAIAQEWKNALAVEQIQSEVFQAGESPKKKPKYAPLFASNAPLPHYLPASVEGGAREVAKLFQNASARMQWVEGVLAGFGIIPLCYKEDPTLRVLFADFLFQIPQRLEEANNALKGTYRGREEAFVPAIRKMTADFRRMEKEIENVRRTVRQQL